MIKLNNDKLEQIIKQTAELSGLSAEEMLLQIVDQYFKELDMLEAIYEAESRYEHCIVLQ